MNILNKIETDFIIAFGQIIGKAAKFEERVEKTALKLKLYKDELIYNSETKSNYRERSKQSIINSINKLVGEYFDIEYYGMLIEESILVIEKSGVFDIEDIGFHFKHFVTYGRAFMKNRYSKIEFYDQNIILNKLINNDFNLNDIEKWIKYFEQIKIILVYFHNLDKYIERYIKTD